MQWSGPAQVMAQASLGSRDSTRLWEEAKASRFEHCSSSQCICTDGLALWHLETFELSTLSEHSVLRYFESMHICTVQITQVALALISDQQWRIGVFPIHGKFSEALTPRLTLTWIFKIGMFPTRGEWRNELQGQGTSRPTFQDLSAVTAGILGFSRRLLPDASSG